MERIVERKLLEKNEFCDYINEIINCIEYYNDLNKIFEKYGVNGCIYPPNCTASLIRMLKFEMDIPAGTTTIEDYCFNSKNRKSSKNRNQEDVKSQINSPQELYDYLLEK